MYQTVLATFFLVLAVLLTDEDCYFPLRSDDALQYGEVDIMFPTCFEDLRYAYAGLLGQHHPQGTRHDALTSQQQFFADYSSATDKERATCGDGYNPILQDFANAAFLTTQVT